MKFIFLFFIFFNISQAIALENISFEVKEPYPVCIQELVALEPTLPLSFFDLKKQEPKEEDTVGPCNDYLCNESKKNGFAGLTAFFQKDFPKVEQELFAQDLIKSDNFKARLKKMNEVLLSCQSRTEVLHKLAAEAAGDIYEETKSIDKIPEGYFIADKKNDFFEFPDSDVKAYVLHPKPPNEKNLPPIISFAGTRSLTSAAADIFYGANQVNNVKVKFIKWINTLKSENQKELIITGHSLGGGLAQTLAAMIPEPNIMNTHVVTFNGFGGKDAIKAYNTIYGGDDKKKDYSKVQATRDAVGYRMEGDVVSLLGERFGETRTIRTSISKLRFVSNHFMGTINEQIAANPHILMNSSREDVSPLIRPISFLVQTASYAKTAWNKIVNTISDIFENECEAPYSESNPHSDKCESRRGNAQLCLSQGSELKEDGKNILEAMEKFRIGCDLCLKDSCVEYAVLNKIVGYTSKTLTIAKKACDLDDGASCIEAGLIIAKDLKKSKKTDNKYVFKGCSYGEEALCALIDNPSFASKYNSSKNNTCKGINSIQDCELLADSNDTSGMTFAFPYEDSQFKLPKEFEDLREFEKNEHPKLFDPNQNAGYNLERNAPVLSRNLDQAKRLIKNGANFDVKNDNGETPAYLAAGNSNLNLLKYLVDYGANINTNNKQGLSMLNNAIESRYTDIAKYLINNGINLENADAQGSTPLMSAISKNNLEVVKLLLAKDVNLETQDSNGMNAILIAAKEGNLEILKLLVNQGAKLNIKDHYETSPLMSATTSGNLEMVKFLVEKGAKINDRAFQGTTPLMMATLAPKNSNLIKFLIEKGAKINEQNDAGVSPLLIATNKNNLELMKYFIKSGADLSHKDIEGNTPLLIAAQEGDVDTLQYLVNQGSNLDVQNTDGVTPMLAAVKSGNFKKVKFFAEHGAKLDQPDNEGFTPLLSSFATGNLEMTKFLMNRGANLDIVSKNGTTPLLWAAEHREYDNIDLFRYLIEKKVNLEASNKNGSTAILIAATRNGGYDNVKYLIEKGAKPDVKDNLGNNLLISATRGGDSKLVEYLIKKGANVNERNKTGKSPLFIAFENQDLFSAKILLEHGAKLESNLPNNNVPYMSQLIQSYNNPFDVTKAH